MSNNIISQLQVTKKIENNNVVTWVKELLPIGAYSNNIVISDGDKKISLTQLYNYLKNFFNSRVFSWYGTNLPTNNDEIINFYQIEEVNY